MSPDPDDAPRDKDVDERFQALVRREFGPGAHSPAELPIREFTASNDWHYRPTPLSDDEVDYRQVQPATGTWPWPVALAVVLLVGGVVATLVGIFGVPLPSPWPIVAGAAAVTGLGMLLGAALRRPPDPDRDDHDFGLRL